MHKMATQSSIKTLQKIDLRLLPNDKGAIFVRNFYRSSVAYLAYFYDVTVTTGNKFGAGTDANVFLRLIGEKGSTDEIQLETKKHELERGMVNSYQCTAEDVGILKKVIIRHDNTGLAPAWFLEKVVVKDYKGSFYRFECNSWLEKLAASNPIVLLKESEDENSSLLNTREQTTYRLKYQLPNHENLDTDDDNLKNVIEAIVGDNNNNNNLDDNNNNSDDNEKFVDGRNIAEHYETPKVAESSTRHKSSLSPAVRQLVNSYGIDLFRLSGSGPHSRVLKGDVISHMAKHNIIEKIEFQLPTTFKEGIRERISSKIPPGTSPRPQDDRERTFTDIPLVHDRMEKANFISRNKFETPHLYTTVKCEANEFNECVDTFKERYSHLATALLLVRALTHALTEIKTPWHANLATVNINVTNSDGKQLTFEGCEKNGLDHLYDNFQQERISQKDSSYGITIMDCDGILQLSSVLAPGQLMCVSFSLLPSTLNSCGKVWSNLSISLTSDGSRVSEEESALVLQSLKSTIEKPVVMM